MTNQPDYETEIWIDVKNNPKFERNMMVCVDWPLGVYVGQVVSDPAWDQEKLEHVYNIQCMNGTMYEVRQSTMERYCPPKKDQRKLLKHWGQKCHLYSK